MTHFERLEQLCQVNGWTLEARYDSKLAKTSNTKPVSFGTWFVIIKVKKQTENYKAFGDDLQECANRVYLKVTQARSYVSLN